MSVDPVLAAEKQHRLLRIEEFLQSNVWFIGPDRPQTRRVLIELLALVPEELLNSLFTQLRLLIIAPRRRSSEVISYRGLPSQPTLDAPFIVVTLDWSIEDSTHSEAFRATAGILGDALTRVKGIEAQRECSAAWSETSKRFVN
jgi:hypothetical protein